MVAPVLIVAVGNESRGDDALGPLLLRKLGDEITQNHADQFELLEEFQLQIEHAMDMQERQLILFIDAGMDTPAPFHFYQTQANGEAELFSHALSPEALLHVYAQLYQQAAPPSFVLCIRGEHFELGAALTPQAGEHLALADAFGKKLLQMPEAASWNKHASPQPVSA